jgi:phosphoglycolate phosphatase-like HAD superfamily hydrolase
MALRVAFDLDGTVADLASEIARLAAELFGHRPAATPGSSGPPSTGTTPSPSIGNVDLTDRQLAAVWDHVSTIDGFWTTLRESEPGIVARIAAVAAVRRWEVIFITTRPPAGGDTTQRQSQAWLEAQGFRWPSVVVSNGSRGSIVAALGFDALVDDRPENCVDVCVESKARALLVWPSDKGPAPSGAGRLGITVVASAGEAVDVLEGLDDERKTPRLLRSVKKLLRRG